MNQKRQFIVFSIAVACGFVLLGAVVFWMANRLLSKREEVTTGKHQLAAAGFGGGQSPLIKRDAVERQRLDDVQGQWKQVKSRLSPFSAYYNEYQNARAMDYLGALAVERGRLYSIAQRIGLRI